MLIELDYRVTRSQIYRRPETGLEAVFLCFAVCIGAA
jgi:hypothetical protein